jgi:hypothetical protein
MKSGACAEIAVIGNEGMIGLALFMGGYSTTSRAIVQSAGLGYHILGDCFGEEFDHHGELLHLSLRYSQALINQMAQTESATAILRWIGSSAPSLDRLPTQDLYMPPG